MNNEVLVRREARKDREQRRSSAPGDLPEPRLQDETRRTVDLGHSSNGPSWIDPAEIRVITTESRLGARLNCLLQQNLALSRQSAAAAEGRFDPKQSFLNAPIGRERRFRGPCVILRQAAEPMCTFKRSVSGRCVPDGGNCV